MIDSHFRLTSLRGRFGLRRLLTMLLVALGATASASAQTELPAPSGIAAIVNGEPITFRDLEREVRREVRLRQVPDDQRAEATKAWRPQILDNMVAHRLIQQQCDRFKIDPSDEMVERFLRSQMESLREVSSLDDYFRYMFHATGDDESALRKQAKQELRRILLYRDRVYRAEYISPRELREYYNANRESFHETTKYKIRYLTIPRTADLAETIQKVEAELKQGTPFETLVQKYAPESDRGTSAVWEITDADLDQMLDPMPKLIRDLEVGQVTPRLDFPGAARYVKLEEKVPGRALKFATHEAQQRIRNRINQDRRRKQAERYLAELLETHAEGIQKFLDTP